MPSSAPSNRQLKSVRSVHLPSWLPARVKNMDQDGPLAIMFPYLALLSWYVFNICTLLTNKYIFQKLPFPTGLTIMHMTTGFFLSTIYCVLNPDDSAATAKVSFLGRYRAVLPVAMSFAGNLYFSNLAMRHVSVPFVQMVKSTVPMFTMFLYIVFKGRKYETQCFVAMVFIVAGVMMAVVTDVSYTMFGLIAAVFAAFATSLKVILTNDVTKSLSPTRLLNLMAPMIIMTLIPVFYMTEWELLRDEYWDRVFNIKVIASLTFHGIMVFCLNFVMFFAASVNSPVIMTVAGNMKVILVCIFSVIALGTEMNMWSWVGCCICLLGGLWFNVVQIGLDPFSLLTRLNTEYAMEQWEEEERKKKSS